MKVHYLDPSAWVKRYFREEGSDEIRAFFLASPNLVCCRLGFLEVVATIARKGRGEKLSSEMTQELLDEAVSNFERFTVIPADELRISHATELALRHRLRTMDSLHLACALSLPRNDEIILVSSDLELLDAASKEGLPTLNPRD